MQRSWDSNWASSYESLPCSMAGWGKRVLVMRCTATWRHTSISAVAQAAGLIDLKNQCIQVVVSCKQTRKETNYTIDCVIDMTSE